MKILMLNYEFPPIGGGAANANRYILAEYTGISDLRIDVLTSAPEPGFYESLFSDNITVYRVGLHKKDLHYWRKSEVIEWLIKAKSYYRKLLNNENYDLAHAFSGFPSGYLCYKTKKRLPYVISLRGSDVPGQNQRLQLEYRLLSPLFRRIWANASEIVACSEGLKQRALQFFPGLMISTIPNGVDLERFQPGTEEKPAKPVRLITVGRLSSTKRVELLIHTVKLLKDKGLEVRLKVVGGGALEKHLRQMALREGLKNSVEFMGRVDRNIMPGLYQQSDIYISATMQEGMSNAMLEAMSSGLPIVTTNCEGLEELINENGIIVQQQTAESIAQGIQNLAENQRKFDTMRVAARKQAEKFSWEKIAQDYLLLYGKYNSGKFEKT
jgi:glycosyltransferase involved in cell wall biosynthesis